MPQKSHSTPCKRPTVLERILAIEALPSGDSDALSVAILPYLYDRSPAVRSWALERVSKHCLAELEGRVLELLHDRQSYVRHAAVECIGEFHGGEQVQFPLLYPFLGDPDALTRVETLESLAYIGDKKALPLMLACLTDKDHLVRSYAALSIAELKGRRFRKQIEVAAAREHDERSKPWFARALFMLGDQEQFNTLIGLLSSPSATARCAAANALADLTLSEVQEDLALAGVSNALEHFLFRSDQSTMERVKKDLEQRARQRVS